MNTKKEGIKQMVDTETLTNLQGADKNPVVTREDVL